MPKTNSKTKQVRIRKVAKWSVIAIIALIVIMQAAIDVMFYRQLNNVSDVSTVPLIVTAIEGVHAPAVVEPLSGDVYLTSSRYKLPAAPGNQQVLYSELASGNDTENEIMLTTKAALGRSEARLWVAQSQANHNQGDTAVFDAVPNAQACSRGVHVMFKQIQPDASLSYQGAVTFKNGKTGYFYLETKCQDLLKPLVPYFMQLQPY